MLFTRRSASANRRRAFSTSTTIRPGSRTRRVVLRVDNQSREPSIVQFISGRGGPSSNEMEVGHTATKRFLINVVQNQGRLHHAYPATRRSTSPNRTCRPAPSSATCCSCACSPAATCTSRSSRRTPTQIPTPRSRRASCSKRTHKHARGIYPIPGVSLRDAVERQRRLSRAADRSDSAAERSARPSARGRLRRAAIVRGHRAQPAARRRSRSPSTKTRAAAAQPERTSSTACSCSRTK